MKFEKNPKYNTLALFALIVVAFAALLISLFTHADAVRAFFAKMARVLMPLLYAAILMLVLMPAVEFFEQKFLPLGTARRMKKPEKKAGMFALIVTYTLLVVIVLLAIVIIIPQFSVLYDTVLGSRDYLTALDTVGKDLGEKGMVGQILFKVFDRLKSSIVDSLSEFSALLPKVVDALGSVVSQVSNLLLGVIISIYALADRRRLKAQAKKITAAFFPQGAVNGIERVTREFYHNAVWFFSARALNSVVLGVVFYFILLVMGVKFHSVLCLIIAVCNFMPVFGVMIGFSISAIVILLTDARLALWFCIVYVVVTLCGYIFLRPRITNRAVRLSLGVTLICILVGFFVGGLLGGLVAVPVYVTARTLFLDYRKYRSGKVRTRNGA